MADRSGGALGKREPTAARPFGYGQERYLWTFMAAVGMFLAGSIFAIDFGAYELLRGEGETEGFEIAYAVLAIAAVAEGTSWLRAPRQTKAEAKETGKPTFSWSRSGHDGAGRQAPADRFGRPARRAQAPEEVSSEIDRDLREAVPDVTEVFIDATPGRGDSDAEARRDPPTPVASS